MRKNSTNNYSSKNIRDNQSDTWFRTILYSIGDAVITIDSTGKVLQMNHIAENLTGWNEIEAMGKKIGTVFHVVDAETNRKIKNPIDKILREGKVSELARSAMLVSRNGETIPISDTGAPIRDKEGKIIGVVLVFRDQTVEREAEKNLRESERKLSTLLAHLPGMSYRCRNDRNWTMEFVSEGCYQLTGYNPGDLIENTKISYNEIVHPEDRDNLWDTLQQVLIPGKIFKDEYRITTKNGTVKWVWEQGQGVFSDNGNLIAIEGFITDITDKKRAEDALRQSQQMVDSILNTIPVRVFWKDRNGIYLGCNKAFALDAGLSSSQDIIGKDDFRTGWVEQAERYRADDSFVIRTGQSKLGYEEPQTKPDGNSRWLRTSKVPLRNTKGEIIGVLGTYEDITKQKEAEEALRHSESLFRTVWEKSLDGMRLTDEEGIILKVNDAFCRLVDMPRDMIEGKPLSVIYENERSEYILNRLRESFKSQTVEPNIETELTLVNGKKIWFEIKNSFFEFQGYKPLLLSVFRDITERINAEEALKKSEEQYRSLFEETKDTVYITTPEGKIIDINPAGLELFGYKSIKEIENINISTDLYLNPVDREKYVQKLNRDGFVKDFETHLKRSDGSKLTVLETATLLRDKDGSPVAYRGILRDITQQRLLEEQLRNAQKMESIGTLAGGVAHDFNNILGIIVGYASLVKMNINDQEKIIQCIDAIQKASDRGASLVQQMLTFARKTDVTYELVNINDVINEIVQLLYETLPRIIEIKIKLKKNVPLILADVTQIHQILLNLSLNARDAMPNGGILQITSSVIPSNEFPDKLIKTDAKEYVEIKIRDTGTGMDEQTKQRIFDPFFTTKGPGKGSGLGLALVYSIIESYNGFIGVESEPGLGTTFSIYLPAQESTITKPDRKKVTAHEVKPGTETILVIEDEELLIASLQSILIERGYNVITARDGQEGVQKYTEHLNDLFDEKIEVIITDLGLPKLTGENVVREIIKLNPAARIILASGFIEPGMKSKLKELGVKEFIQKPYLPDNVLLAIQEVLS